MRKGRDGEKLLFRGVICCSGGLYAVQGGYMLFRWVIWMFRRVVYCSGIESQFKDQPNPCSIAKAKTRVTKTSLIFPVQKKNLLPMIASEESSD